MGEGGLVASLLYYCLRFVILELRLCIIMSIATRFVAPFGTMISAYFVVGRMISS
jgi:hypothetical protein